VGLPPNLETSHESTPQIRLACGIGPATFKPGSKPSGRSQLLFPQIKADKRI